MRNPTPQRRRRTRWLLLASLAVIALVMLGTEFLLQLAPEAETDDFLIEGLPPLASEEVRDCFRGDQATIGEIRSSLTIEGRVSSAQVYACPSAYDGALVTYVGEVIGEVIERDGGAWVQVNDDDYALETGPIHGHRTLRGANVGLSVWLPDGLHDEVEVAGRSGRRGEVISVIATVQRADPTDGGGLTLRAETIEVLSDALAAREPFHEVQAIVAGVLAAVAAVTVSWARSDRRR